tara:strand:- start:173 stop:316 length:144 start_codon:yes stop_codon:yes gene_type:complete
MSNPRHDRKDNQHSGHLKKEIRSDSRAVCGQIGLEKSAALLLGVWLD